MSTQAKVAISDDIPARMRAKDTGLKQTIKDLLRDLLVDRVATIGVLMVLLVVFGAIFAPWVSPYDPSDQNIGERLMPWALSPGGSVEHILGTDQLGRDILSRIIWGARISLLVGFACVLCSGALGVIFGVVAGFFGGKTDTIIMRWVDIQTSFPGLLMAMLIIVMIGPSAVNVVIVLVINGWMVFARLARGQMLQVREMPYIEAAKCLGVSNMRIMVKHALPNILSPLLTLSVLEMARFILAESTLSFLGLGIQPPEISWGLMVSDGQDYFMNAWWLITFPGIALAFLVLGVNLVASWLRTVTDPYQRNKQLRQATQ